MTERTCSIPGCDNIVTARGWCRKHYRRWHRHGDPLADVNRRAPNGATLSERMKYVGWKIVARRHDMAPCWEWNGLRDARQYGRIWDGDRVQAAHRASYTLAHGSIPAGMHVLHQCDNPPCVNPAHLTVGDDTANMAEMVARERSANGERRPHKLTDADVADIRATYTGERGQQTRLAEQYGVSQSRICMIVRNRARTEATHWKAAHDDSHLVGSGRCTV